MRILHVIHSLSGGGAERQLNLICNALNQFGVHTAVFCVDSRGNQLDEKVMVFQHTRTTKYDHRIFSRIHETIRKYQPDLVHLWLPSAVIIPAMCLAKLHGVPILYSYRNKMFFSRPIFLLEFISAALFSSRIVSNNPVEQSSKAFQLLYRVKRGVIIQNATPKPTHTRQPIKFFNRTNARRLLFVGRLAQQKNVSRLIDALHVMSSSIPWTLDIYGVGELEFSLRCMCERYQLCKQISFMGFNDDVCSLMPDYDALIFPSLYEGMPNVLIEALARGLPVLASDIIANRDSVKGMDVLDWFDPLDIHDIARCISRFLQNPCAYSDKSERGKEVASLYSVERTRDAYIDLYKSMLQTRGLVLERE